MWQEIIVYLVGVLAVVYVAIAVYRFATKRSDPCSGCAGCDLKRNLEQKRKECGNKTH